MNNAYLLMGSNEGDRLQMLHRAISMLESYGRVAKQSSVYQTAAWGMTDQPDFLNMAVLLETDFSPLELLAAIEQTEKVFGRNREVKWGPRTLDIDILLYNNEIIATQELTIPHPYLHVRRFALTPLDEIAADIMHPKLRKTIHELLISCPDNLEVKKTKIA